MKSHITLDDLATEYSCDKLFSHSYIPFYEELFTNRNVRRLLEIGIGYEDLMKPFVPKYVHGSSLLMWRDYFPDAEIFACDIRPDTLINEGRIHSRLCDQSDETSISYLLAEWGTDWDVVIDDGSHVPEHQVLTARAIVPSLPKGSVYVIEDVRDPDYVFMQLLPMAKLYKDIKLLDVHQFLKRPDDCLVVIEK